MTSNYSGILRQHATHLNYVTIKGKHSSYICKALWLHRQKIKTWQQYIHTKGKHTWCNKNALSQTTIHWLSYSLFMCHVKQHFELCHTSWPYPVSLPCIHFHVLATVLCRATIHVYVSRVLVYVLKMFFFVTCVVQIYLCYPNMPLYLMVYITLKSCRLEWKTVLRAFNKLLIDGLQDYQAVYSSVDDILVYSDNWETQVTDVKEFFEQFVTVKLVIA